MKKDDHQKGHSRKNTANIGGAAYAPQQDEPHSKGDAILVVRRRPLFPERLRHDAKHGPAVETEETVKERRQFEITELHSGGLHSHAETSPRPRRRIEEAKNRRKCESR